jgi:hypothetical protein
MRQAAADRQESEGREVTYEISAPALHAARTLLRHYVITEKIESEIEFSVENLARLIDRYTHAWQVKIQVRELTSRINWLPDAGLEDRLAELRDSVMALDTLRRDIPRYEGEGDQPFIVSDSAVAKNQRAARARAPEYHVSAAAIYAIRMIQEHYHFTEAEWGQMDFNEVNAAGIIDVCCNVFRVQDALHRMCAMVRGMSQAEMAANMATVRTALKALDIAVSRMPGYQPPTRKLAKLKEGIGVVAELSHEQKRNRQQVALALSRARTPEEGMRVLNNARSDKLL